MRFEHLSSQVVTTLLAVLGLLVLASVIALAKRRGRSPGTSNELDLRIRTWWKIAALFGLAIALDRRASVVFLGFVSFLAFKEYLTLVPTRRNDRRVFFWAYLAIPLQYYFAYVEWYGMFIVLIPVFMFMLLPTRMVMIGDTQGFLRALGALHWGLMTTVFSLSHTAYLLVLRPVPGARVAPAWPDPAAMEAPGVALLILLVLLTELNDVAQYVWGKSIGRIRVVPKVSPGKTLGGLIGGVATTVLLAGLIGPWLTILDLPHALVAGLVVGLGGFAGDLSISALKRDLGVKDSGSSLPGHGGILDRVDSLTFTAPLFFHLVFYWYA